MFLQLQPTHSECTRRMFCSVVVGKNLMFFPARKAVSYSVVFQPNTSHLAGIGKFPALVGWYIRLVLQSVLFSFFCAYVHVLTSDFLLHAQAKACPLARGWYFSLCLSMVSLNSGAPTRFNLVGVPLLFFVSIGRFGDDNNT
jgi:hypothetical protein